MAVMRGAAISILLAAVLSAGCAAVLVRAGDEYQPQSAYIYGRFLLDTEDKQAMAFSIRCRDGKRYKIVFSKQEDEALRMIRLPAGVCQLDDVVGKGVASHREMAAFRLLNNEHLQPGGVYYVGDFAAAGSSKDPGYDDLPVRHRHEISRAVGSEPSPQQVRRDDRRHEAGLSQFRLGPDHRPDGASVAGDDPAVCSPAWTRPWKRPWCACVETS